MKVILKEEILRLNCPGFGEPSFLTIGQAKSLDAYKAIFVNPESILHLFDRDQETLKQVENAQSDGLTSVNLASDDLLNALNEDISVRTEELVRFLENGGLLVYFLCRPFVLQGPGMALDNYVWLLSLAPVKSSDKNVRQMSTMATGRNIEPCEEAATSEFADYFQQEGLEWNTIIRSEFLTDGYTPLATAGPKKCIAGELYAGDNGGRIVFLPAPYSPDFDRSLIQCANFWYQKVQGLKPDRKEIAQAVANQLSPPRAEQKPALLKPSSTVENTPALQKPSPATTSGNGAVKAAPSGPAPKPQAPAAKAQSQVAPLQRAATTSSSGNAALASTSSTTHPRVPAAGSPPAAPAAAKPGVTPLVRGEPGSTATADKIPVPQAKAALTTSGTTPRPPAPQDRKPAATSQPAAPPPERPPDLTTTADRPRPKPVEEKVETVKPTAPLEAAGETEEKQEASPPAPEAPPRETPEQAKIATTTQSKAESLVRELEQAAAAPANQQTKISSQFARTTVPDAPALKVEPGEKPETAAKKLVETGSNDIDWAVSYSMPGLEELRRERGTLIEQLKQMQSRMLNVENRLSTLNHMKNTLLSGGDDLLDCSMKAMSTLGWKAKQSPSHKDEIWLSAGDKPEALARVIRTPQQPSRSDLAQLAESIITFWGESEVEPKGIMIACAWADTPLAERKETPFPDALVEFAKKKNICLLTTMQVLCAYRDVEFGKASGEDLRKSFLATSGALEGLQLETIKLARS